MVAGICPRELFAYIRIGFDSREEEAFRERKYSVSTWGIDEYGLMHEDDSRSALFFFFFERERKRTRSARGYIPDLLLMEREIRLLLTKSTREEL